MNRRKKDGGKGNLGPEASQKSRQAGDDKENNPLTRRPRATKKTALTRKRKATTSFLDLPLDPAFIIFSMLRPHDLLSLARVSKNLRRTLIDANSTMSRALWREKRQEVGAPNPPPGFTEAKWLTFLFGWHCYSCGTARETLADFYLLKRLCRDCKKTGCISAVEYRASEAGGDSEVIKFVLYTPDGHYDSMRGGDLPYWSSDVQEMAEILGRLDSLAKQGASSAVQALTEFKRKRLAYLIIVRSLAPQVKQWVKDFREQQQQRHREVKQRLVLDLRRRFRGTGKFDDRDIDSALTLETVKPSLRRDAERIVLTDKVWRRFQPRLTGLIEDAKKTRHAQIRRLRMWKIENLWLTHRVAEGTSAEETASYPPFYRLLQRNPSISQAMDSNLDHELTEEKYCALANRLPAAASTYVSGKKTELVKKLRYAFNPVADTDEDALELATSVFVPCDSDDRPHIAGVLVGWKMLSAFHDDGRDYADSLLPDPSPWLSGLAHSLVTLCGLNSRIATVEDMDEINQRFFCVPCVLKSISDSKLSRQTGTRMWNADIFTWTAALLHARIHHDEGRGQCSAAVFGSLHHHPRIQVLRHRVNVEEVSLQRDSGQGIGVWACKHCKAFVSTRENGMFLHLEESHSIGIPQIGEDYHIDTRICFDHPRPCRLEFQLSPGEDEVALRAGWEHSWPPGGSETSD